MLQSNMLQNDRMRALQDSIMPREQAEENGLGELVNFALANKAPFKYKHHATQMQILKSKTIATSVINQLGLADDPDFKDSGRSLRSVGQRIRGWFGGMPPG